MRIMLLFLLAVLLGHDVCSGKEPAIENTPAYYYFHGQPEAALSSYLKSVSSVNVTAAINASIIMRELGRNGNAVSLLEKSLSANPESNDLNSALAWAYLCSGDATKAGEMFDKAARKDGKDNRALLGLSLSQMKDKKYVEAGTNFQRLTEIRNLSAAAYYFLGRISEENGDTVNAADLYDKAIKEDSHFVEGRPRMARIFESRGRVDDAWKQYSKIAMMDPYNKPAAEKKKTLLARLTKKPEEILEAKKIKEFTRIQPAPSREDSPEVRIGIGATAGGNPAYKDRVVFRVSGPFSIINAKTGKELASGKANEAWAITVTSGAGNPSSQQPPTGESGSAPGFKAAGAFHSGKSAGIVAPDGRIVSVFTGSVLIRHKERGTGSIILDAVPYGSGMAWSGVADKELRGEIEIVFDAAHTGLYVINRLPLEEYLYGVLAAEMPTHWPLEALKAQAVIARTYALHTNKSLRPHSAHGYDLCDEQHCQVYSGVSVENAKTRSAADLTRGKVLAYEGKTIHAVFSSNCGGHTQGGSGAGWADLPYWRMVNDGDRQAAWESPGELSLFLKNSPELYCRASKYTWAPEYRWTRHITAEDLVARLSRRSRLGRLKKIVFTRGESGRVSSAKFVGTRNELKLTKEQEIRRYFGLAPLRSTLFTADVFYEEGFVKSLLISGGGWGHGVGLCQSGAAGRAEVGAAYEKILPEYYPGAVLSDLRDLK